jgi:hypothetical protein
MSFGLAIENWRWNCQKRRNLSSQNRPTTGEANAFFVNSGTITPPVKKNCHLSLLGGI